MAKAILLCGTQASGKSTYAVRLGVAIHSRDEVRARLRAEDTMVTEDVIWETTLKEMAATLQSGRDAILDSTLANPKRRDEAVAFFMQVVRVVEIHRVHTPLAECHRRNNHRSVEIRVRPDDIDRTHWQIEDAFASNPPRCRVIDVSGTL